MKIGNLKDLFEFQIRRNTNRLCRSLLMTLEDINAEEEILSQKRMSHLRKRVLDHGNDFIRDLISEVKNYRIDLDFDDK